MLRLIHERKVQFLEVNEVDFEVAGLLRFGSHPLGDGQADSALADTADDNHEFGHA